MASASFAGEPPLQAKAMKYVTQKRAALTLHKRITSSRKAIQHT